jgi:DNA polymerase-3 subunit epsilon
MSTAKWHESRMVAFDVESTGTNVHADRIVTAAIVHHTPGQRPRTLTWLIDPQIEIPAEAAAVHGWTTDRIRSELAGHEAMRTVNGRHTPISRDQALFEIGGHVALPMSTSTPLVAMNAAFDLTILEVESRRHQVPSLTERLAPKGPAGVVDPMVLDKAKDPYRKVKGGCRCGCGATDKTLTGLCAHYGVLHGGAHDAAADALAALRLTLRFVALWPEIARWKLSTLHEKQVGWRAEQCDSLRSYFDKVGTVHDGICPVWPVHGACCAPAPVEQEALV